MRIEITNSFSSLVFAYTTGLVALAVEIAFHAIFIGNSEVMSGFPLLGFVICFVISGLIYIISFVLILYPARLFMAKKSISWLSLVVAVFSVLLVYCFCFCCCRDISPGGRESAIWALVFIIPSLISLIVPPPW